MTSFASFPRLLRLLVTMLLLAGTVTQSAATRGDTTNPTLTIKRSVRGDGGGQNMYMVEHHPQTQTRRHVLGRGDNETKPRTLNKKNKMNKRNRNKSPNKQTGGKSISVEPVDSAGASETSTNNIGEESNSGNDTQPESLPPRAKKDKDALPLSVKETDPLVQPQPTKLEQQPSLLASEHFQMLMAVGILAASFLIHYIRMKRSKTKTSGGNAYKQIPMDGGEAEMTQLGSSSMDEDDLDAEYGEEPDVDVSSE